MKNILPILFSLLFLLGLVTSSYSQNVTVKVKEGSLDEILSGRRSALVDRLRHYEEALNDRDLGRLYKLLPLSKRSEYGQDYFSNTKFNTLGQTQSITIVEAFLDSDPVEETGKQSVERWHIRGCAEIADKKGKIGLHSVSFSVLFLDDIWYIESSGRPVGNNKPDFCAPR